MSFDQTRAPLQAARNQGALSLLKSAVDRRWPTSIHLKSKYKVLLQGLVKEKSASGFRIS
jgi:hypothetical protein